MINKKILLLGGTAIQIPIIKKAKEMGLYVITCDNRPDNPGHALADEYHNISITDNEAVLTLARELKVDAVVNYILEAGIQAAAYAHEQLGKPTSPYASVHTLSNKQLFRKFLREHGFCVPKVYQPADDIQYPVVVKPADLWGSRGFSRVDRHEDLQVAIDYAMQNSLYGEIIIEQFIEPWHAPVEGDGFAVAGKLTTHVWGDCYSDPEAPNPITPVLYCYPSEKPQHLLRKIDSELQRLMDVLHMQTNAYNIEVRVDDEENVYLMEVAPRNGSNATTEVTSLSTGCDIMEGTIRAALGEDCSDLVDAPCKGFWASYIVHTNRAGKYEGMSYDVGFMGRHFVSFTPFVKPGDMVYPYTGTNRSIGMLIAKFKTREELNAFRDDPHCYFDVLLQE